MTTSELSCLRQSRHADVSQKEQCCWSFYEQIKLYSRLLAYRDLKAAKSLTVILKVHSFDASFQWIFGSLHRPNTHCEFFAKTIIIICPADSIIIIIFLFFLYPR